jgi:flagellar hook-basal body complex protein FliE
MAGSVGSVGNITANRFEALAGDKKIHQKKDGFESFANTLQDAIQNVNQMQLDTQKMDADFVMGKTDNIHQVMVTAEKANIALQLTLQVRNKALDAYNEIMRMQF